MDAAKVGRFHPTRLRSIDVPRYALGMTILVPLLVCLVGAVVHLTSSKGSQLGLWAFGVGLWWTLALVGHQVLHFGP